MGHGNYPLGRAIGDGKRVADRPTTRPFPVPVGQRDQRPLARTHVRRQRCLTKFADPRSGLACAVIHARVGATELGDTP